MTKAVRIATVGAALAGSVVLLQGSLASASPSSSGGGHHDDTVLQFDVEFSPFHLTDPDGDGPTAGDTIVFDDVLLADGAQVGHEVGSCVVVDVTATGPLASCTAVITLDDGGTIAYSLENSPPPRKVLAVTGGSGPYRSAGGEGVLLENGDGTGTLTLDLDLARDLDD
jgi:hypothetical protein